MHGVSPFLFPGCGRYAAGEKNRAPRGQSSVADQPHSPATRDGRGLGLAPKWRMSNCTPGLSARQSMRVKQYENRHRVQSTPGVAIICAGTRDALAGGE